MNCLKLFILLSFLLCSNVYADTWTASAYCACEKCCGKSDSITACGLKAKQGRTVALNWLPFGTLVWINDQLYQVEDRGAKSIFGSKDNHKKRVDIYFNNHNDALKFGKREVELKIIN